MSNYLPGNGIRDIYVKDSGDDDDDGRNVNFAVRTIAHAITLVNELDPATSLAVPSAIIDSGFSTYVGVFNIPDNTLISLPNSSLKAPDGVSGNNAVVTSGENSSLKVGKITTTNALISIGYKSSHPNNRLEVDLIDVKPSISYGYFLTSGSTKASARIGRMTVAGASSIGLRLHPDEVSGALSCEEVRLNGDGVTALEYDALTNIPLSIRMGAIRRVSGVNTTALNIKAGHCIVFIDEIDADVGITLTLENALYPTILDIFCLNFKGGTINVDEGCTLNILSINYEGNYGSDITNNGEINGRIGDVSFGKSFSHDESTTLIKGGQIIQGSSSSEMTIAAGRGRIFDYTDPDDPLNIVIAWPEFINVPIDNLTGSLFSYVCIDRFEMVQQFLPGEFTEDVRRDYVTLGVIRHPSGVFDAYDRTAVIEQETYQQFLDLLDGLGVVKSGGLDASPILASLSFSKQAGVIISPGAGTAQGNRAENTAEINADSLQSFDSILGINGDFIATTTLIDPGFYDNDGTKTVVPGGVDKNVQIVYVFQFPTATGGVIYQYGQNLYDTVQDAVIRSVADNPVIPEYIKRSALLLFRMAIHKDCSDIADTTTCIFLRGAKFGIDLSGGGGAGGLGGDFFGAASSVLNEIVTFGDNSGKTAVSNSDITVFEGEFRHVIADAILRLGRFGVDAQIIFGNGDIIGQYGASNSGLDAQFSVSTGLAGGNVAFQLEAEGVVKGQFMWDGSAEQVKAVNETGDGLFIEADGQLSGPLSENNSAFGHLISGDRPFGLPSLSQLVELGLTPETRMLFWNPTISRVRYYDGSDMQSVANVQEVLDAAFDPDADYDITGDWIFSTFVNIPLPELLSENGIIWRGHPEGSNSVTYQWACKPGDDDFYLVVFSAFFGEPVDAIIVDENADVLITQTLYVSQSVKVVGNRLSILNKTGEETKDGALHIYRDSPIVGDAGDTFFKKHDNSGDNSFISLRIKEVDGSLHTPIDPTTSSGIATKGSTDTTSITLVSASSYTVLSTDAGNLIKFTSDSDVTLTVPVGLGDGFTFMISQRGNGLITWQGGATLTQVDGHTKTRGKGSLVAFINDGDDDFAIAGATQ